MSILLGERMKPPSSPQIQQGKTPNSLTFNFKTAKKPLKQRTGSPGCSCCVEQTDSSRMPFPLSALCKMPSCSDRYSHRRKWKLLALGAPQIRKALMKTAGVKENFASFSLVIQSFYCPYYKCFRGGSFKCSQIRTNGQNKHIYCVLKNNY